MSISVYIVDDHAVFRSGIRALLERESDVQVAGETGLGIEAIRAASEIEFDVLLLDISLPDISGARVAERVLKVRPRLAIVALTMHEDEEYFRELFKVGARGYMLKKSSGNELLQAVRTTCRGGIYVDPALSPLLVRDIAGPPPRQRDVGLIGLLTPREREVCRYVGFGYTNSEVADKLNISARTVETHRANIMAKLNMKSRADLVRFALDNELLTSD
jgi:DNA-binding NarL/FixJ family response regulator